MKREAKKEKANNAAINTYCTIIVILPLPPIANRTKSYLILSYQSGYLFLYLIDGYLFDH